MNQQLWQAAVEHWSSIPSAGDLLKEDAFRRTSVPSAYLWARPPPRHADTCPLGIVVLWSDLPCSSPSFGVPE